MLQNTVSCLLAAYIDSIIIIIQPHVTDWKHSTNAATTQTSAQETRHVSMLLS